MAETSRERLVRVLGMIAYLEAHGSTPFTKLAEHFGVPVARIEKDLWTLSTSGVPPYLPHECIDFDFDDLDNGIATLTESQGATQVRLSGREAVALIGALATMISAGTAPDGAAEVLDKLQAAYGGPAPVDVVSSAPTADAAVTGALKDAIVQGQAVELSYTDAQDRRSTRIVEPHRLVTIDGVGYVECFCLKANDYRTLRLSRINSAAPTDVLVTRPPTEEHGFTLEPLFRAEVSIRRNARWAFEDIVGVEIIDNGDLATVTFGVPDVDWAAARVLSIAPLVVSINPAELRAAVSRHANAVGAAHSV